MVHMSFQPYVDNLLVILSCRMHIDILQVGKKKEILICFIDWPFMYLFGLFLTYSDLGYNIAEVV